VSHRLVEGRRSNESDMAVIDADVHSQKMSKIA